MLETELEILKRASAYFARGERARRRGFRLFFELVARRGPVAVVCRVLKVSKGGLVVMSSDVVA